MVVQKSIQAVADRQIVKQMDNTVNEDTIMNQTKEGNMMEPSLHLTIESLSSIWEVWVLKDTDTILQQSQYFRAKMVEREGITLMIKILKLIKVTIKIK